MIRIMTTLAAMGLAGAAIAASSHPSFTAAGESCDQITWQAEVLERYPNIAGACQGVEMRDGEYYVRVQGSVRRVNATGSKVTLQFKGLDEPSTIDVPTNMRVHVRGRSVAVRDLQRGDTITAHLPASRFVAHFYEPESASEEYSVAEFAPVVDEPEEPMAVAQLPATASLLPWLAVAGSAFSLLGIGLWIQGRRRDV